ncbi:DNA invertase Pin-like site-specific DNA recombinase [Microvirga flocculans]|uniref:DNA invertase Pin-like site-specific DNA recombinase n=1 Tax=Microvirga flocculans TaxID=217168 RepID=A0A7W6N6N1_9HYPH|nr:recombinase family protein [Microvirga flocculans]MBB4038610.1 DNA invertase Pin-like site-specific DNA recombinase [Microvirga flocculans]
MAEGTYIAYYRVSTAKQGASGLGLEAQKEAVRQFLNGGNWTLAAEFTEVESGKHSDRPELAKAFRACRLYGAKLVIAKLDRLSRDAHFLLGLEKAGVDFVAADMPHANRLTVGIMAMVADEERRMISARTKAALKAAKARGVKLGGNRGSVVDDAARQVSAAVRGNKATERATDLAPIIEELKASGVLSLGAIAKALNERGIPTARGGNVWTPAGVSRVLARLA